MPLTQKQVETRRHYVGASEVPVLFGENRYSTAWNLWAYKTGRVIENPLNSEAAEVGHLLEPFVLNFAEERLGALRRNQQRTAEDGILRATLDAQLVETSEPVEAKTTGIVGNVYGEWGEDGTDEVPNWVLLQTQTQLHCINKLHPDVEVCHVPALIGRRGRVMFKVKRSQKIIDAIRRRAEEFWKCVENDIPPENTKPTLGVATRLIAEEGLKSELPAELVREYYALDALTKEHKKKLEDAKIRVLAALDKAEIGTVDGNIAVTAKLQQRKITKYIGDDFERDHAITFTEFRVLRIKKGFEIT